MHFTLTRLLLLIGVLLASGGLLWGGLCALMAWSILRPARMSAGKAIYHLRRLSPGDLGLSFEEDPFSVRDVRTGSRLHIAGWWIPASPGCDRCAILIHGYADAKVGSIAWAPLLNDLNFNILAIDLRAHGDSGGRYSTGGFFEREDLDQVIDQLRARRANQTRRMVLFGISVGASVACAVARRREDISGIILDSPFPSYEKVIAMHALRLNLPRGMILHAAISLAEKISGADFSQVSTTEVLKQIHCPVLAIVGGADVLLDADDIDALEKATRHIPKAEFWLLPEAGHLQAMPFDPIVYRQRIESFVDRIKD